MTSTSTTHYVEDAMRDVIKTVEEVQAAIDHIPEEKRLELALTITTLSKKLLNSIMGLGEVPGYYYDTLRPAVFEQIAAAEKRTEIAADAFISAAEAITPLALKTEGETRAQLQAQVNAIFEASSFQDLVAQHLNEIKLRLSEFDAHMEALQAAFEGDGEKVRKSQEKIREASKANTLLNGPTTKI